MRSVLPGRGSLLLCAPSAAHLADPQASGDRGWKTVARRKRRRTTPRRRWVSRASRGRCWSINAGYAGPQGDARQAFPSLKIAPAGGHTGGPVGAEATSASSRATGTNRSGRERGYWEPRGHIPLRREESLVARVCSFFRRWVLTSIHFLTPPDARWPRNNGRLRKAFPIQTPSQVSDRPHRRSVYSHREEPGASSGPAQQLVLKFFSFGKPIFNVSLIFLVPEVLYSSNWKM